MVTTRFFIIFQIILSCFLPFAFGGYCDKPNESAGLRCVFVSNSIVIRSAERIESNLKSSDTLSIKSLLQDPVAMRHLAPERAFRDEEVKGILDYYYHLKLDENPLGFFLVYERGQNTVSSVNSGEYEEKWLRKNALEKQIWNKPDSVSASERLIGIVILEPGWGESSLEPMALFKSSKTGRKYGQQAMEVLLKEYIPFLNGELDYKGETKKLSQPNTTNRKVKSLCAVVSPNNSASQLLMEKFGFGSLSLDRLQTPSDQMEFFGARQAEKITLEKEIREVERPGITGKVKRSSGTRHGFPRDFFWYNLP